MNNNFLRIIAASRNFLYPMSDLYQTAGGPLKLKGDSIKKKSAYPVVYSSLTVFRSHKKKKEEKVAHAVENAV